MSSDSIDRPFRRDGGSDATAPDRLDPVVWRVAIAVIVGAFMSILDMTIVNVGLEELGRDLGASGFDEIQWVMTAYMLAVAAVIPVTGWASERIGGRRLFLGSLVAFIGASVLCAISWDLWSLVAFRVLQGVAGGMLMPAGQMLLARVAGPRNMGKVMAVIGAPVLLAPVLGPVLGGVILHSLSWHWMFLVNVPVGIIGVIVVARLIPREGAHEHRTRRSLDVVGLALLSVGLPLVVYGLANVAGYGVGAMRTWSPIAAGLVLVAIFALHALRANEPLLDVRLFRVPAYAYASITTFSLGAFLFGSIILLPLYYQVARGEGVLEAGFLMAPQGIGAAIGVVVTGRLVDRVGGGPVVISGILVLLVGTVPFVMLGPDTSYWWLSAAMVVRGLGFGATMMPTMAASYAALSTEDVGHATPQMNVLQRLGGSVGAAIFATILQAELTAAFGGGTRIGEGMVETASIPPEALPLLADSFSTTFAWVLGGSALALVPASMLLLAERRVRRERAVVEPRDELDAAEREADAMASITTGEPV